MSTMKKPKPGKTSRSDTAPSKAAGKTGVTKIKTSGGSTDPTVASLRASRLKSRDDNMNSALKAVFGTTEFDAGDPPDVVPGLAFDSERLLSLAEMAKEEADKLDKDDSEKQHAAFTKRMEDFAFRLKTAQTTAERIEKIEQAAAAANVTLADRELFDAWQDFLYHSGRDEQATAANFLKELESRIKELPGLVALYNTKSGQAAVKRIPAGLFAAAGDRNPIGVLLEGLDLVTPGMVTSVAQLQSMLSAADPPDKIPEIITLARAAGTGVFSVLARFDDVGNATEALYALRAIDEANQTADFFITGDGRQTWADLAYIGRHKVKVWPGGTVTLSSLKLGTKPDGQPVTFDDVYRQSVRPKPGKKHLTPDQRGENPHFPRYLGRKPFVNDGIKRGVVLPFRTRDGAPIHYQEFDVRPYTSQDKRGVERFVQGYGRLFYSDDHYKTFKEVR